MPIRHPGIFAQRNYPGPISFAVRWKRGSWPIALALATFTALAEPPEGYYDTADESSAAALRDSLHAIIDDHQRLPYTSDQTDTWDILEMADQNPADAGRIVTIYRNISYQKRGGGNNEYNREHSWPRSYGFPNNDGSLNYPFTDMHHLFLADAGYNSERSNKPFEDCDANCIEWPTETNAGRGGEGGAYPGDSNWTDGEFTQGRWQVWRDRRGDIARAMMYMDIRYEGGVHGVTGADEPDLRLTDDRALIESGRTDQNEPVAWMGMRGTLLRWNAEDPVDALERRHHEAVFAAQGNRNPFIDQPGWAGCIYRSVCGFQVNAGLNDAWFNAATAGQGFFFVVYPDIPLVFIAWFTYDTERPPEDVAAMLGEPGHRWITGQGGFAGDNATLDAFLTAGGVFDSAAPAPDPAQNIGTMSIVFHDCENATLTYDLTDPDLSGSIELTRIALDNVALCEALNLEAQLR